MHILHLHSSFDPGGKELRCAQLINAFGPDIEHSIVSAQSGALGAASAIAKGMTVHYPQDFPALNGKPSPARLRRIAMAMQPFDLVLSYNWGAMDGVMAHTVFRDFLKLPPLVHHEDGFNEDEAMRLKKRRNIYRRVALFRSSGLVVPSTRLEQIALGPWGQPRRRVHLIGNGIDTNAFANKPKPDSLPRVIKRDGEKWVGTMAGLRAVKNLPRLVRAFSDLPEHWQLVIFGDGPEREAIRDEAMRMNVAPRVQRPGFVTEASKAVALLDIFALSSDSEQFPISVVEAMAAGLPVASFDVGDVAAMIAPENREFIAPAGDEAALAEKLEMLAVDDGLRAQVGEANRLRAVREYDEKTMVSKYSAVEMPAPYA